MKQERLVQRKHKIIKSARGLQINWNVSTVVSEGSSAKVIASQTSTPTATPAPSPSPIPTLTPVPTPKPTPAPTPQPTSSPTPSPTPTITPTQTPTPSPVPTPSPTPVSTPQPPSVVPKPSSPPSVVPTPSPIITPSPPKTPSIVPSTPPPTVTPTPSVQTPSISQKNSTSNSTVPLTSTLQQPLVQILGGGIIFLVVVIIIIVIAIIIKNKKATAQKYEVNEVEKVEEQVKKHPLQGSSLMDRFNNKGQQNEQKEQQDSGPATKNLANLLGRNFNDKFNHKRLSLDNKQVSLELQDLSNIYEQDSTTANGSALSNSLGAPNSQFNFLDPSSGRNNLLSPQFQNNNFSETSAKFIRPPVQSYSEYYQRRAPTSIQEYIVSNYV